MIDLKELRKRAGMTQTTLSEKSGVSQQAISMIEHGHRNLNVQTARKLAPVLGVNWYDFFEGKEESA